VAPPGIRSGHELSDLVVRLAALALGDLDQRVVSLAPAGHLADVELVLPERPRHLAVDLDEERDLADHRGHILGVAAQGEVPVAVRP